MPTRNSIFSRFVSSSSSLSASLSLVPPSPPLPLPSAPSVPSGCLCVTPPTSMRCKKEALGTAGTEQQQQYVSICTFVPVKQVNLRT